MKKTAKYRLRQAGAKRGTARSIKENGAGIKDDDAGIEAFTSAMTDLLANASGPWAAELTNAFTQLDFTPTGIDPDLGPDSIGRYLEGCIQSLPQGKSPDNALADFARNVARQLSWYQIFDGGGVDPGLERGMLAGQIVGTRGLYNVDRPNASTTDPDLYAGNLYAGNLYAGNLYAGLFLLAPGIYYPLHQHPALEVYAVLSGNLTIHHGRSKPAMVIGPGQISITPPWQVHSLTTVDHPCLVAYAWTGDLTGENWWWQQDEEGQWWRHCWERQASSAWAPGRTEKLTPEEMHRAGDPDIEA